MRLRIAALHLLVLWAFAVAQPLFDLLGKNGEFFAARGSTRWDVVLFAFVLLFVPPAILTGIEALVPQPPRAVVHVVFVGALVGLFVLQGIRGVGWAGWLLVAVAAAVGTAAALAYLRLAGARLVLTVLAPAPLLFLALFLLNSDASRLTFTGTDNALAAGERAQVPVRSGRLRRAAGQLAARRARQDRRRSLPQLRRPRRGLDLVREHEHRGRGDDARGAGDPHRAVPACG